MGRGGGGAGAGRAPVRRVGVVLFAAAFAPALAFLFLSALVGGRFDVFVRLLGMGV